MIVEEKKASGGTQVVHRFDNGFGASVISNDFSYGGKIGLWEIAVIKWEDDKWELYYNSPITHDVIGFADEELVEQTLKRIENLPKE